MKKKMFCFFIVIFLILISLFFYRAWNLRKIKEAIRNDNINELIKYCEMPLANVNGRNPFDFIISVLDGIPEPRPMFLALRKNNIEAAEILINHGADLKYRAPFDDYYYLDYAIAWGETDIVVLLVKKGAPLKSGYNSLSNLLGNLDETVLLDTFNEIRELLNQYNLLNSDEYEILLQGIALHANTDVLNQLLKEDSVTINYQFSDGKTLIYYTLWSGFTSTKQKYEFISFLLVHNFDKSIEDKQGNTAYDYAIEFEYDAFAELLILD